jgi:hypothetical protein
MIVILYRPLGTYSQNFLEYALAKVLKIIRENFGYFLFQIVVLSVAISD